jgi:hypothetical protein
VLGCLRAGGFSVAAAATAFATIDAYVYGFALQEVSLPFEPGDDVGALADEMLAGVEADFPHLVEIATVQVKRPGYAFGDEFEPGLDLVLDALERLRARP